MPTPPSSATVPTTLGDCWQQERSRKAIFAGEGGSSPCAARQPLHCPSCEYRGGPAPRPGPRRDAHGGRGHRSTNVQPRALPCCCRSRGGINFWDPASVWCLWDVRRGGVTGWKRQYRCPRLPFLVDGIRVAAASEQGVPGRGAWLQPAGVCGEQHSSVIHLLPLVT